MNDRFGLDEFMEQLVSVRRAVPALRHLGIVSPNACRDSAESQVLRIRNIVSHMSAEERADPGRIGTVEGKLIAAAAGESAATVCRFIDRFLKLRAELLSLQGLSLSRRLRAVEEMLRRSATAGLLDE
jgi:signal recognition particle GTPase